jgi:hypothetical protein
MLRLGITGSTAWAGCAIPTKPTSVIAPMVSFAIPLCQGFLVAAVALNAMLEVVIIGTFSSCYFEL